MKTIQQLKEIIPYNPDRIMLDNMSLGQIKEAVEIVKRRIPLEVSGNINLNTAKAIAETGVNFISIGHLTHSVKSLDISLQFTNQ